MGNRLIISNSDAQWVLIKDFLISKTNCPNYLTCNHSPCKLAKAAVNRNTIILEDYDYKLTKIINDLRFHVLSYANLWIIPFKCSRKLFFTKLLFNFNIFTSSTGSRFIDFTVRDDPIKIYTDLTIAKVLHISTEQVYEFYPAFQINIYNKKIRLLDDLLHLSPQIMNDYKISDRIKSLYELF